MILIEAFPVNIISDMPGDQARISVPSDKEGDKPFAGVFAVLTSERSSTPPESWDGKKVGGFERAGKDSERLLSDHSIAANLVGVCTAPTSHPESGYQHQDVSGGSLGVLGQSYFYAREAGLSMEKDPNVFPQPGFTQEEVFGFASIKGPDEAKELLLKLGLNASEIEQLVGMKSNGLDSRKDATLISRLMNALRQEGVTPDQVKLTIHDLKNLLAKTIKARL